MITKIYLKGKTFRPIELQRLKAKSCSARSRKMIKQGALFEVLLLYFSISYGDRLPRQCPRQDYRYTVDTDWFHHNVSVHVYCDVSHHD